MWRWLLTAALAGAATGCERLTPNDPPATRSAKPPGTAPSAPLKPGDKGVTPTVADGKGLVFSFFDRRAQLRTVDRIADIPRHARQAVMVVDPKKRQADDAILVADLRKPVAGKAAFHATASTRGAWLAKYMPRLSPTRALASEEDPPKTQPQRRRRRAKASATKAAPSATLGAAAAGSQARPQVVMFSTSWCPSCRSARAYFDQRGLRYVDLDVEKDPAAAKAVPGDPAALWTAPSGSGVGDQRPRTPRLQPAAS